MVYKFKEYERSEVLRDHLNMGGENPSGERIDVTSLYFERASEPWLPVMGEYHFSRASRADWKKELLKMKAGGVDIVATYLFWIYHEEEEGKFDFSGDLDIRAFVEECAKAGMEVVLRIGPWAHGECRNGGFPDWLVKKPYKLRDNNAEYMEKAEIWYRRIYEEVKGLFYKDGGNIIAIQLENELVDNAEHIAALKKMTVEIGYDVPLYTVTGWNSAAGAKIPVDEVVPVFGGYIEMPWDGSLEELPPSIHYFFNRMRNDSAIGTDLIAKTESDGWQLPYERYPFATCELGGGCENTHHRRAIIHPMDIYALSLVKLGCGNNLIGYYMYHGGTNKLGRYSTFNESRATGYPNDCPVLSYDFQAPISEYGEIRDHYRLLNMIHMFASDFGKMIAPMEAVDSAKSVDRYDTSSLRYGMRTDGESGFVFVNHHQRHKKLSDIEDVVIDTGEVRFPSVSVKGEICFFMPFNMKLDDETLIYATAQPLCRVDNAFFFIEIPGIQAEYKFQNANFRPDSDGIIGYNGIKIVTLCFERAKYARKLSGKLYIGNCCDVYEYDGDITSAAPGDFSYDIWTGSGFETKTVRKPFAQAAAVIEETDEPFTPPYHDELELGGERSRKWYRIEVDGDQGFIEIDIPCDVAQLYADGELAADEYYYGVPWRIPADMIYGKECYIVCSEMKDDFYREF